MKAYKLGKRVFAALVLALGLGSTAGASESVRDLELQAALILNGYYAGPLDGDIGPRSREALARAEAALRLPGDPNWPERLEPMLRGLAERSLQLYQIQPVEDSATSIWANIPVALLDMYQSNNLGMLFYSQNKNLEIQFIERINSDISFDQLYIDLISNQQYRNIEYSSRGDDWFVINSETNGTDYYMRFLTNGESHRGFAVSFDSESRVLRPIVIYMSETFRPFLQAPVNSVLLLERGVAEAGQRLDLSTLSEDWALSDVMHGLVLGISSAEGAPSVRIQTAPPNPEARPFIVSCDFYGEGGLTTDTLRVGPGNYATLKIMGYEPEPVSTIRTGNTISVFRTSDQWAWSVSLDALEGIGMSEVGAIRSVACRLEEGL
jgi:peptidoglycan hydrolase-like protein with peptidoglycan-binding domain